MNESIYVIPQNEKSSGQITETGKSNNFYPAPPQGVPVIPDFNPPTFIPTGQNTAKSQIIATPEKSSKTEMIIIALVLGGIFLMGQ